MINQNSKLSVGIAVLFEMILIGAAFMSITSRLWKNLTLTLLAMVCLLLPFIITRIANMKHISLPPSFQLITVNFVILAQYLGEIKKFYQIYWWWDLLLHAIAGSFVVIITLYIIKGIIRKEQETTDQRFTFFTSLAAFSCSIALGTLWEMFEFSGDYLFKA